MRDNIKWVLGGRRLLAATAGLLLAVASVTLVSAASADTRAAAPAAPVAAAQDASVNQVAPGSATLFFDWGCDGTYSSTSITFNAFGTFSTGDGFTGTWVRIGGTAMGNQAGMLTFHYGGSSETTYSSVTTSGSATGIQTTFSGGNGCHYILRSGLATAGVLNNDSHTADGTPIKR
jgi:hypothetical protein